MRWLVLGAIGIVAAFLLSLTLGQSSPADVPETADSAASSSTILEIENNTTEAYDWYPVVKVVDGDTLTIAMNGKNVTLRLIGLDTPEVVDPRKPVQCFGREASEKAKEILSGASVRLEMDPSQGELDKYGRTLAYVFLLDGTNFNEYLIAEGYGHEYTYNLPYKYQTEFQAAEKLAREQKKGLWADGACAESGVRDQVSGVSNRTNTVGGAYECSRNAYNCSDFSTQSEAQAAFESCGGSANDIHKLDADGDSKVCESLP